MENKYQGMPQDRWLVQESLKKVALGPKGFMDWVKEHHEEFDTPFFNLLRKMREYTEKTNDEALAKTFTFLEQCFQKIFDLNGEYGSIVIAEDNYTVYWSKASAYLTTERAHHAIPILEALAIFFNQNNKQKNYLESTYSNLGTAYAQINQHQKALKNFHKALSLSSLQASISKAKILSNIAMLNNSIGNYDEAIDYQQKALEISKSLNRTDLEVKQLNNLTLMYMDSANISEAMHKQKQAHEAAQRLGDEKMVADTLTRMGILHAFTGDLKEAKKACSEAISIQDPFSGNE